MEIVVARLLASAVAFCLSVELLPVERVTRLLPQIVLSRRAENARGSGREGN